MDILIKVFAAFGLFYTVGVLTLLIIAHFYKSPVKALDHAYQTILAAKFDKMITNGESVDDQYFIDIGFAKKTFREAIKNVHNRE